jgi:hypothetical protein
MRATKPPDDAAVGHDCPHCRLYRGGIPAGPFTPREFAALGLGLAVVSSSNGDRVEHDPDVIAAEAQRDEARRAYDLADGRWLRAVAEHRSAELLGDEYLRDEAGQVVGYRNRGVRDPALARLEQAEKEAAKLRSRGWERVVEANDAIIAAQHKARFTIAEAARNGQNSNKGRRA